MIDPLRIEMVLECAPAHAFRTWTERFATWWPKGHSMSGDPAAVVLEPRAGGRIYERTATGEELDWGRITVWDPPERLGYRWHIGRSATEATDVEIRFTPWSDAGTLLTIVHSGWEVLGDAAPTWRDANREGWGGLLPHFVSACAPSTRAGGPTTPGSTPQGEPR